MLAALIISAAVALAAVCALTVVALRSRLAPGPELTARTVVVNTRKPDDQTIKGILHGQYADRWTLRNAVLVVPNGEQPIGGLTHIPVANIAFAQEIATGGDG